MQKLCYLVDKPSSDKLYQIFKCVKIQQLDRPKPLKGTVSRDFLPLIFSWISFPQPPDYTIRAISNFFENSRRFSQLNGKKSLLDTFATGVADNGGKFATGNLFQGHSSILNADARCLSIVAPR